MDHTAPVHDSDPFLTQVVALDDKAADIDFFVAHSESIVVSSGLRSGEYEHKADKIAELWQSLLTSYQNVLPSFTSMSSKIEQGYKSITSWDRKETFKISYGGYAHDPNAAWPTVITPEFLRRFLMAAGGYFSLFWLIASNGRVECLIVVQPAHSSGYSIPVWEASRRWTVKPKMHNGRPDLYWSDGKQSGWWSDDLLALFKVMEEQRGEWIPVSVKAPRSRCSAVVHKRKKAWWIW